MVSLSTEPLIFRYDREKAVQYAHSWACGRNPSYYDYEKVGGDCTNFVSQVIYAGGGAMNYTSDYGWYYINGNNKSPSWTGVNHLCNFLINNNGVGPFGKQADIKDVQPGDVAQLSFTGGGVFQHSSVIIQAGDPPSVENILVATHTDDQDYYSLTGYDWVDIRFIHISGVRKWV